MTAEPIVKPVLTRQLGLHKWTAAELYVREEYSSNPGVYIISRAAGCMFCINVNEQKELRHVIIPETSLENAIDLTY